VCICHINCYLLHTLSANGISSNTLPNGFLWNVPSKQAIITTFPINAILSENSGIVWNCDVPLSQTNNKQIVCVFFCDTNCASSIPMTSNLHKSSWLMSSSVCTHFATCVCLCIKQTVVSQLNDFFYKYLSCVAIESSEYLVSLLYLMTTHFLLAAACLLILLSNSVLFPENIGPKITSILPSLGFAICWCVM
jgi:hypothetical protein